MNWYLKVLKQYFDFSGRARRKEYWMFILFNLIFMISLGIIAAITENVGGGSSVFFLLVAYMLGVFIPSFAVLVRRLHDVGKSGWMVLVYFIPIIGKIWLLVLCCTDSEGGSNEWGVSPKRMVDEISDIGKE